MRKMCVTALLGLLIASPSTAIQGHRPPTVLASYYGHGKMTASGERFIPEALTAAHRTLPFGSKVKVTNLKNGLSVLVKINDRGPMSKRFGIDLSIGAARQLDIIKCGVTKVTLQLI